MFDEDSVFNVSCCKLLLFDPLLCNSVRIIGLNTLAWGAKRSQDTCVLFASPALPVLDWAVAFPEGYRFFPSPATTSPVNSVAVESGADLCMQK